MVQHARSARRRRSSPASARSDSKRESASTSESASSTTRRSLGSRSTSAPGWSPTPARTRFSFHRQSETSSPDQESDLRIEVSTSSKGYPAAGSSSRSQPQRTEAPSRGELREEVALGRHDQVPRSALATRVDPSQDRDRHSVELAHDQLGRPGDLVRDRDDGRAQLVAVRIARTLQVAQHLDA